MIPTAVEALKGSGVKVASVATYFPSGQAPLEVKLHDVRSAVELGADEIDMVIDRGAFLAGDYASVYDEIIAVKEACGDAHLKVILETGELETYDNVRRASVLAMAAGADFIKTCTGKVQPAATLPVTLVMLEAIRDFHAQTGRMVGMKPAGGIRTVEGGDRLPHDAVRDARPGLDDARPTSASAPPASSTTCSCRSARSAPADTAAATTSPSTDAAGRSAPHDHLTVG